MKTRTSHAIALAIVAAALSGFLAACAADKWDATRKDIERATQLITAVGSAAAQLPLCPIPAAPSAKPAPSGAAPLIPIDGGSK